MTLEQATAERTNIIEEVVMHKAKLLAIQCIDLRFQEVVDQDLQKRVNYGEFDRISLPGASKEFETVKNAALVSLKLHDPDQVIIYEHEDCGAYEKDNSPETHLANAKKLANALVEAIA